MAQLFHCSRCHQEKHINEAASTFKTGFKRVDIPVGICITCKQK